MSFDYDINHYTFDDLKKLFNVKDGETVSNEEIDMRIANIRYTAEQNTTDETQLKKILNFLPVAKEKFKVFVKMQNIEYNNVYPMTERLEKQFIPNKMLDKNAHAIIEQTPDIVIPSENKYININSADRDVGSWPNPSEFEVELPDSIRDVTFATLFDYNFYVHVYNISDFYQNTKFSFQIGTGAIKQATLANGFYSDSQLADSVAEAMNKALDSNYNRTDGAGTFGVTLDSTSKKYVIYNSNNAEFTLKFDSPESYTTNKWQIKNIYGLSDSWGLGYFLGFDKDTYTSTSDTVFYNDDDGNETSSEYHRIVAPNVVIPTLNHNLFLEIDGFNHVQQTRQQSGVVNSYFSRIPIINGFANDVGGYERANISVERLSKLKIRLRFHNGILLDLQGQNFDFTLMFGCKK